MASETSKPAFHHWRWIVLAGAFLCRVVTTGTVVCMGVFFDDIKSSFPAGSITNAQLSLVFSSASGLLEGLGVVNSILILKQSKFEARYLVFFGGIISFTGVLISSFTTNYGVMLAGLGIFNGIGQSIGRFILPAAVGYVFDDRSRHIGLSVMNAGDGVGGVLFPVLLSTLIDVLTWRGALAVVAALTLNLCVSALTVPKNLFVRKLGGKVNPQGAQIGKSTEDDATASLNSEDIVRTETTWFPNIIFFYLNIISHSVGYFVFLTFVYSDMKERKISPATVKWVVSIIGGVSIVGRLSVSFMNHNRPIPRWLIYAAAHVVRGLSVLATLWVPSDDPPGAVLFYSAVCAVFGLTDGITGALIAVVCVDLFGLGRFAAVLGGEMLVMGAGAFLGVPIAGFLKDAFKSFQIPFAFAGCSFLFAGVVMLPLFFTKKHYQQVHSRGAKFRSDENSVQINAVELISIKPRDSL